MMYEDCMRLFESVPGGFALYMEIEKWILSICPDAEIAAKKTQVSFSNGCIFAIVSPPMRGKQGATLTLCLPERLNSQRVFASTQPYPGRWTHHFLIRSKAEMDDVLTLWLQTAHNFARVRRRK